jgi:geranylgeranyl pyrophosphate synthase
MLECRQKALDVLQQLPDSEAKTALGDLVAYTTERSS